MTIKLAITRTEPKVVQVRKRRVRGDLVKVTMRLTPEVHRNLKSMAALDGKPFEQFTDEMLRKTLRLPASPWRTS